MDYLNGIKHNILSVKKKQLNETNIRDMILNLEFVNRTDDFIKEMKSKNITATKKDIIYTGNYYAHFSIHCAQI